MKRRFCWNKEKTYKSGVGLKLMFGVLTDTYGRVVFDKTSNQLTKEQNLIKARSVGFPFIPTVLSLYVKNKRCIKEKVKKKGEKNMMRI